MGKENKPDSRDTATLFVEEAVLPFMMRRRVLGKPTAVEVEALIFGWRDGRGGVFTKEKVLEISRE